MNEPSHRRGTLIHGGAETEFYYPHGTLWRCKRCGRCCMDVENWDRRVLLLRKDVMLLEAVGKNDFYESVEEGKFVAVIRKQGGRCVFLGEEGCRVYEARPLLCRMYPFYVERLGDVHIIGVDMECPGVGEGDALTEGYFRGLLGYALSQMEG